METQETETLKSFWVGLEIPNTDCHVTIAFRDRVTPQQLKALKQGVIQHIKPLLPLHFRMGGFQMRGTPPDTPAYNVFVKSPEDTSSRGDLIDDALQSFYQKYTWRAPEKPQYPRLEYHASCKTQEKRAQLEHIVNEQNGYFTVSDVYMRPLGSSEEVLRVSAKGTITPDVKWTKDVIQSAFGGHHKSN